MKKLSKIKFGWTRDTFDNRDFKFKILQPQVLPKSVDLRKANGMPVIYDQGSLGSCTANAIAAAISFEHFQNNFSEINPSRLFIYYNERVIEHSVKSDDGAQIRDGVKSVHKQGVCDESEWGYILSAFTKKPGKKCYQDALANIITKYQRVNQTEYDIKLALSQGFPVVFGIDVYSSFMSTAVAKTGKVLMPSPADSLEGGHAVLIVGYNDNQKRFIVRNSWGTDWGIKGYFTLPYEYVLSTKLSSDFWILEK